MIALLAALWIRSTTLRAAVRNWWIEDARPALSAVRRWLETPGVLRGTLRLATIAIVVLGAAVTWNGLFERTWAAPAQQEAVETAPAAPPPVIEKVASPAAASDDPQLLRVSGKQFGPGLTAQLIAPLETTVTTFPASALEEVTATGFRLRVVLEQPGVYALRVRSAEGVRSDSVTFTVKAPRRGGRSPR